MDVNRQGHVCRRTLQEGAAAFRRGAGPSPHGSFCNPEDCQSIEHYGWLLGWNTARVEAEREAEGYLDVVLRRVGARVH